MKIPIYILGFLKRYGPLHGYRLKGLIGEMVSDFTQIKLPAIYYHLEKLEKKGLVYSEKEQDGKRPERSVYAITKTGEEEFSRMLVVSMDSLYRPEFDIDSSLYFFDSLDKDSVIETFNRHEKIL